MSHVNRSETAEQVGEFIGRSIAKTVVAEGLTGSARDWTGLDAQDADQIPAGMDAAEVERHAEAAYAEYLAAR